MRRSLRDVSDPFTLPERDFRGMFRLSREAGRELLSELLANNPELNIQKRSDAIPFNLRYFTALNFFAHGSYQKPTGENVVVCQSQPSVSRSLKIVVAELLKLSGKYIHFPQTADEIAKAKIEFMQQFAMPGIVAAVDGTHVAIVKPSEAENGHLYCNRKHFYSMNVLAACDANGIFVFADGNYPGSTHDSAIYAMTGLRDLMPNDGASFLLGDSGFPADGCMLTPLTGAETLSGERYNRCHKKTRNIIERTFGVLKMRFRCLLKDRVLHYKVDAAVDIIYACILLHNLCEMRKVQLPDDAVENEDAPGPEEVMTGTQSAIGRRVRDNYIRRYY